MRAPNAGGRPVVEEQVAGHDVRFRHARLGGDFGAQSAFRVFVAEERQHIHLRVVAVTVVDVAVEVDRHVRNQRRVALQIDQLCRQPAVFPH